MARRRRRSSSGKAAQMQSIIANKSANMAMRSVGDFPSLLAASAITVCRSVGRDKGSIGIALKRSKQLTHCNYKQRSASVGSSARYGLRFLHLTLARSRERETMNPADVADTARSPVIDEVVMAVWADLFARGRPTDQRRGRPETLCP